MSQVGRHLVIVLALIGAGVLSARLLFPPEGKYRGIFTDGERHIDGAEIEGPRLLLWGRPEELGPEVNSLASEGRPALDAAGEWLFFQVGRPGENVDLWIAEVRGGRIQGARALREINSAADDMAPSCWDNELYFSSNRDGGLGGLDLYRAAIHGGRIDEPEWLGRAVNSPADETDPVVRPGRAALYFASNRGPAQDHDIYVAALDESGAGVARRTTALSSPFDDREVCFSPDGNTVWMASDRLGGRGAFDLWRTTEDAGAFLPPEPLEEINSPSDERGPWVTDGGFTLLFASDRDRPQGALDLFRAPSRELYRLPAQPASWLDFTYVVLLLLVALLAWLARRWAALEIIYKCLVLSLLIHVLLLAWFKRVEVGAPEAPADRAGKSFRVRLAVDRSGESLRRDPALITRGERLDSSTAPVRTSTPARVTNDAAPVAAKAPDALRIERVDAALPVAVPGRVARTEAPGPHRLPTARVGIETAESRVRYEGAPRQVAIASRLLEPRRVDETEAVARAAGGLPATPLPRAAALPPVERRDVAPGSLTAGGSAPAHALRTDRRAERPRVSVTIGVPAEDVPSVAADGVRSDPGRTGEILAEEHALDTGAAIDTRRPARTPDFSAPLPETGPTEAPPLASRGDGLVAGDVRAPAGASRRVPPERGAARLPEVPLPRAALAQGAQSGQPDLVARADVSTLASRVARPGELDLPAPAEGPARHDPTLPAPPRRHGDPPGREVILPPAMPPAPPRLAGASRARDLERSAALDSLRPTGRNRGPRYEEKTPASIDPSEATLPGPEVALRDSDPGAGRSAAQGERRVAAESPFLDDARALSMKRGDASAIEPLDTPLARVDRLFVPPLAELSTGRPPELEPLSAESDLSDSAAASVSDSAAAPDLYRSRFGSEKSLALERFGGSARTERAVTRGLRYLATIQDKQGYWGSRKSYQDKYGYVLVGKTGLCLLAYLGAGHTPISGTEYTGVTRRAIDFLIAIQDEESGHFGYTTSYSHGIATYALAECYALTHMEQLRPPLERAVRHIIEQQHDDPRDRRSYGGWGYYYPDGRIFDRWPRASITAWQVMALKSARLGGIDVPEDVFERAAGFLGGCFDQRRGSFRYNHDPSRLSSRYPVLPGSTPAALFALDLLGRSFDPAKAERAFDFVIERRPRKYLSRDKDAFVYQADGNLYFWYYGSLACFFRGGPAWKQWNDGLQKALLPAQQENGSWQPISVYAEYAGDSKSDRSYTTAMCVLMLEVYYRYFTPLLDWHGGK